MAKILRCFLSAVTLLLAGYHVFVPSLVSSAAHTLQTASLEQSSDPFLKGWLKQDVAYIASEAEKAAYQNLASDADRYLFIERFWQQRDPSNGTAQNEFRDQHYWRINYANERFGGPERGWKTDRGRIYITWGPPDQIEAHPSGEGRSGPFEIWRYRAGTNSTSERILEFTGVDYKLREK
jgi:GWxTD domain-containing protein